MSQSHSKFNYYAFGSQMPGRNYTSSNYRYGFNGKENDNEVKGTGNSVDFGARIYDPRLGRWLSLDPLQSKYPALSPYNFCNNNPVLFIDPDGKDIFITHVARVDGKPAIQRVHYKNGELYNDDGTKYGGSNAYFMAVKGHLDNMKTRNPDVNTMISDMETAPNYHEITNDISRAYQLNPAANIEYKEANWDISRKEMIKVNKDGEEVDNTVTYFPNPYTDKKSTEVGDSDKEGILAHELKHGHDKQAGKFKSLETSYGEGGVKKSEISAVKTQNKVLEGKKKDQRTTYGKDKITKKDFESVK